MPKTNNVPFEKILSMIILILGFHPVLFGGSANSLFYKFYLLFFSSTSNRLNFLSSMSRIDFSMKIPSVFPMKYNP